MKPAKRFAVVLTAVGIAFAPTFAQGVPGAGVPLEQWAVRSSYEPTAQRLVYTAARSLGLLRGAREQDFLVSIIYEATGTSYAPDRSSAWTPLKLDKYIVEVSYPDQGMRVDAVSNGHRLVQVVAGSYAWNEGDVPMDGPPVGASQIPTPASTSDRQVQLDLLPFSVIKLAHRNVQNVTVTALEHGTFLLALPYAGNTMKITLDRNRRPARVELGITHPVLGKTTIVAEYSGYKDFEGRGVSDIFFPSHIVQKIGDHVVQDLEVSRCDCVNPYVIFPVPESVEKVEAITPRQSAISSGNAPK